MQSYYTLKCRLRICTYKIRFIIFSIAVGIALCATGCKKLVQVDGPPTSINADNVFHTDATAIAVLNGIYGTMSQNTYTAFPGITSMSFLPGLSADELTLYSGGTNVSLIEYYTNSLNTSTNTYDFWTGIYPLLYSCNLAFDGVYSSTSLTPAIKQQLMGEALFCRAFCYFYLTNLYGNVPMPLSTDYTINSRLSRAPQAQVWQQIVTDLRESERLLSSSYLDATLLTMTTERTRPTKWAATALLARAYLYKQVWDSALLESDTVINNVYLYHLDPLDSIFLKNSTEAIWQLQPVLQGYNTVDARTYILPASGPSSSYPVYLNPTLVGAFEVGDNRRAHWVNEVTESVAGTPTTYYYAYKYKVNTPGAPVTEYAMVLRLAEQYLIRAEAEAEEKDLADAVNDLNIIRTRAGLPNTSAASQSSLLTAILHERQVELFTEWGHRWLDLKRTGSIDSVMTVQCLLKGGTWNDNLKWYPIPASEILRDNNLVQNAGY